MGSHANLPDDLKFVQPIMYISTTKENNSLDPHDLSSL